MRIPAPQPELDAVARARRKRDRAQTAFLEALYAARDAGHSWREIGTAAGLAFSVVRHHLLKREESTK